MADLVNNASERDLGWWLSLYGDERLARPIAKRIASERARGPITTTRQLADLVYTAYPPDQRRGRIHPATRTFQALRIASNDELGAVERGLRVCAGCRSGGRMAVISFHSGEDRIVKQFFRELTAPRGGSVESLFGDDERGNRLHVDHGEGAGVHGGGGCAQPEGAQREAPCDRAKGVAG